MSLTVNDVTDKSIWDKFICSHQEANFLQSWQWGEFHSSRDRDIVRRGLFEDGVLVGAYTGHVEPAKRGRHMQVVGGPILDWSKREHAQTMIDDIHAQAAALGCVYARVRPQNQQSATSLLLMKQLGMRRAPMYLSVEHAGVLDLNKTEEEILAGMRQRLRRSLRKATKNNISIETSTNPDDIHEFYKIQLQTAGRHQFVAFSEDFLKKQFEAFAADNNAVLYTAKYQGDILAQNFMIFYGNEASYHYGVSTELGTKLSGAPLLHMQAMRDARERGINRYNFWGIVDEDDTKHRYHGVSVFKRGFGVEDLKYTPAHDLVIKKSAYLKTFTIETARRKLRKV